MIVTLKYFSRILVIYISFNPSSNVLLVLFLEHIPLLYFSVFLCFFLCIIQKVTALWSRHPGVSTSSKLCYQCLFLLCGRAAAGVGALWVGPSFCLYAGGGWSLLAEADSSPVCALCVSWDTSAGIRCWWGHPLHAAGPGRLGVLVCRGAVKGLSHWWGSWRIYRAGSCKCPTSWAEEGPRKSGKYPPSTCPSGKADGCWVQWTRQVHR